MPHSVLGDPQRRPGDRYRMRGVSEGEDVCVHSLLRLFPATSLSCYVSFLLRLFPATSLSRPLGPLLNLGHPLPDTLTAEETRHADSRPRPLHRRQARTA